MVLSNGAQACNVFWQVGSSATLGANSTFKGSILAFTSATLTTGANVEGRVLARNGAVTLDTNVINVAVCAAITPVVTPTPTSTPTSTPVVTPTPTPNPAPGPAAIFPPAPAPIFVPAPVLPAPQAPVIVAAPVVLPETGFPPEERSAPWKVALLPLIAIVLVAATVVTRKRAA